MIEAYNPIGKPSEPDRTDCIAIEDSEISFICQQLQIDLCPCPQHNAAFVVCTFSALSVVRGGL